MPTVLITGASRGLGLGFATRFAENGWRVLATARQLGPHSALAKLSDQYNLSSFALDVTCVKSLRAAAAAIDEPIDVLLNNAAIQGSYPQKLGSIRYAEWDEIFRTNVLGVMRSCQAFKNQVERSRRKVIVNVSSRTASIGMKTTSTSDNHKGDLYLYRSSKSALNMVSRCLSAELQPLGISVVMLSPGWVRTDLGGLGAMLSVEQSVGLCVPIIQKLTIRETGKFIGNDGLEVPW